MLLPILTISIHNQGKRLWESIKWSPWIKCFDLLSNSLYFYRVFSHDVTPAILVFQTMKWLPCWCPEPVLWELNSFLMQMPSFVAINLHRWWPCEWKRSYDTFLNNFSDTLFLSLFSEVLGALVSVLIIWVLTGVLVYLAVQRVITRDFDINADIMLITAGIGLGVNIL